MIIIVFNFTYDVIENVRHWHRRYNRNTSENNEIKQIIIFYLNDFYPNEPFESVSQPTKDLLLQTVKEKYIETNQAEDNVQEMSTPIPTTHFFGSSQKAKDCIRLILSAENKPDPIKIFIVTHGSFAPNTLIFPSQSPLLNASDEIRPDQLVDILQIVISEPFWSRIERITLDTCYGARSKITGGNIKNHWRDNLSEEDYTSAIAFQIYRLLIERKCGNGYITLTAFPTLHSSEHSQRMSDEESSLRISINSKRFEEITEFINNRSLLSCIIKAHILKSRVQELLNPFYVKHLDLVPEFIGALQQSCSFAQEEFSNMLAELLIRRYCIRNYYLNRNDPNNLRINSMLDAIDAAIPESNRFCFFRKEIASILSETYEIFRPRIIPHGLKFIYKFFTLDGTPSIQIQRINRFQDKIWVKQKTLKF